MINLEWCLYFEHILQPYDNTWLFFSFFHLETHETSCISFIAKDQTKPPRPKTEYICFFVSILHYKPCHIHHQICVQVRRVSTHLTLYTKSLVHSTLETSIIQVVLHWDDVLLRVWMHGWEEETNDKSHITHASLVERTEGIAGSCVSRDCIVAELDKEGFW